MKDGQQTGNTWNTQIAIISIAAHAYKTRARGLKSIDRIGIAHRENHQKLRADRQFAVAYLKAALEDLDDPNNRAAGLLALRDVAEAYGGLGMVAEQAGIGREALYRSLSPKGNPTLKTLLAVLKSVGMRLSVEPENHAHA